MPLNAKHMRTPQERRADRREATLLIEVAQFMRVTAYLLQGVLTPAYALWRRLARTDAYKRVDGVDIAQDEPVWDAAATLEANLGRDLAEMMDYLRHAARRAERAARRRV